jgi:hypothetical protein
MFEGNIAHPTRDAVPGQASLRPLEWPALVAQLAAARDLRAALGRTNRVPGGSFARLAAGADERVNESDPGINHGGLAHGKSTAAIIAAVADTAADADRETR